MNFSDQVKALYSKSNLNTEEKVKDKPKIKLVNIEAVYSVMDKLTDSIEELTSEEYAITPELVGLSKGLISIYAKTVKELIEESVPVITIEADLKGEK